ncbi:hypothetical protein DICA3_F11386 [Diutina catenulata]
MPPSAVHGNIPEGEVAVYAPHDTTNFHSRGNRRYSSGSGPDSRSVHTEFTALSDATTFHPVPKLEFELQPAYVDNFSTYLPFVAYRRVRSQQTAVDDDETIQDVPVSAPSVPQLSIMGQPLAHYSDKVEMVIYEEMFSSAVLVFASEAQFQLFKSTRNSRASPGMPLLKITAPYLSQVRPNSPYLVFKGFEAGEEYPYCTMYMKQSKRVRRLIFNFTPPDAEPFRVVTFTNHYRPFADFNYKGTRFRVVGTPVTSGYLLGHKLRFRLYVIDDEKASLCDDIINKKDGSLSLFKRREGDSYDPNDPATFPNPMPNPENPLITDNVYATYEESMGDTYISENSPPFGGIYQTSSSKSASGLLKKYREVARVESYQGQPPDSGVEADNLVIDTILMGLRDVAVRTSYNIPEAAGKTTCIDPNIDLWPAPSS